jgi:hypothetical protein
MDLDALLRTLNPTAGPPNPMAAPNPMVGGITTPAPPVPMAPRPMAQGPQKLGTRQIIQQLAPILMSAIVNRKNPHATAALVQGMAQGRMAADTQRMQAAERDEAKRQASAKMLQEFAGGALQLDDPEAFAQYLDLAEMTMGGIDPSYERGTLRSLVKFPAGKAAKKTQAEAKAKVDDLRKMYGENFEQVAETASVQFKGKPVKVRELLQLAEMNLTTEKGPVPLTLPRSANLQGDDLRYHAYANQLGKKVEDLTLEEINAAEKKPAAPKSLQRVEVNNGGRKVWANYNPESGTFTDLNGQPMPNAQPIPDKPTGGQRPITGTAEANLIQKLSGDWTKATAEATTLERQFALMKSGLARYDADPNGASQAVLITFQKILDPTSVVRETEYARSAQGLSFIQKLQGYKERLERGGAGVPKTQLAEMVKTAEQFIANTKGLTGGVRRRIGAVADRYNIPKELIFSDSPQDAAPLTAKPKVGDIKYLPDGRQVKVTGFAPDGSPIVQVVR